LVIVQNGTAQVVTNLLMTRNDWLKTSPATFVAGQHNGRYFASYEYVDDLGTAERGTFIIDLSGEKPFMMRAARYAEACWYDLTAAALYMVDGFSIYEWDALGESYEIMTWGSKEYVLQAPVSYGAILIESDNRLSAEETAAQEDAREAIEAANAVLFAQDSIGGELNGAAFNVYPVNGDALERLMPATFVQVKVYADDELVSTISDTDTAKRLPAKGRARKWEVEVNGTRPIAQISMATTMQELNAI
jgi:hypothetical protein